MIVLERNISPVILGFCRGALGQALDREKEKDAEQEAYLDYLFPQPLLLTSARAGTF